MFSFCSACSVLPIYAISGEPYITEGTKSGLNSPHLPFFIYSITYSACLIALCASIDLPFTSPIANILSILVLKLESEFIYFFISNL